jgi:hypothetical protein
MCLLRGTIWVVISQKTTSSIVIAVKNSNRTKAVGFADSVMTAEIGSEVNCGTQYAWTVTNSLARIESSTCLDGGGGLGQNSRTFRFSCGDVQFKMG